MTSILTAQQAANALRVDVTDLRMLDLLPQVDLFIQKATGRDWTQDSTKNAVAVSAATMLLVLWFDNPSQFGSEGDMPFGFIAALTQLEAEALKYRSYQFAGLSGAGAIYLHFGKLKNEGLPYRNARFGAWPSFRSAYKGDVVIKLIGISGVTGSQVADFESEISIQDHIQQISTSDLSNNLYVVILKSPADDIVP